MSASTILTNSSVFLLEWRFKIDSISSRFFRLFSSCISMYLSIRLFALLQSLKSPESVCVTQVLSIRWWFFWSFSFFFNKPDDGQSRQTDRWWQIQSFYGKLPISKWQVSWKWMVFLCYCHLPPALRWLQTKVMVEGGEREQPLDDIFQLMMATSLRHGMLVNVVNYPNIALLRVVNYHDLLYIYIYIYIFMPADCFPRS